MSGEPALRFLVDVVEAEGGITEDRGDSVLLVVGPALRERFGLPEELTATEDPEVAGDEGALLAVPGQALVVDAAEMVLRRGDAGWRHLDWPSSPPPTAKHLEQAARDEVPVDHGRIDVEGQPTACWLPVLQVSALIEHRVSVEQRYEERAELFVDARTGGLLPSHVADGLAGTAGVPGRGAGYLHLEPALVGAVRAAHAALEARAAERQAALVRDTQKALRDERERVDAYYCAALASIEARRDGASPDRARLYDAQEEATRAEWSRRREETEAKFTGSRAVVPFRLHLIEVPALDVPVTVRRGPRAFGLRLQWLLPFPGFLPCRCPHCGAGQPLVAGRDRLGCRACLAKAARVDGPPAAPPPPAPLPPGTPVEPARQEASDEAPEEQPERSAAEKGPEGAGRRAGPPTREGQPRADRSGENRAAGSALRDKRVEKVWYGVAKGLWQAAARFERYGSVARRSPLETLYRCYGPPGPLCAVGLPPDALPTGMHAFGPVGSADEVLSTSGVLTTSEGRARFTLRWRLTGRDPAVVEVLPLPPSGGGRSLPRSRRGGDLLGGVPGAEAPRPEGLGQVETLLWQHAVAEGLPLVIRSLTVYWRVQGHRRLDGLRPAALAAAVEMVARRHSNLGGPEKVARRHGVPVAEVRDACQAVDTVLGAAAEHQW